MKSSQILYIGFYSSNIKIKPFKTSIPYNLLMPTVFNNLNTILLSRLIPVTISREPHLLDLHSNHKHAQACNRYTTQQLAVTLYVRRLHGGMAY